MGSATGGHISRGVRPWLAASLGWTLLGLLLALQNYFIRGPEMAQHAHFIRSMIRGLTYAYVWALLTPAIVWVCNKHPMTRSTWMWRLPLHLVTVCTAAVTHTVFFVSVICFYGFLAGANPVWSRLLFTGAKTLVTWEVTVGLMVVGLTHALHYHAAYLRRIKRSNRLALRLVRAELTALKLQLQPHFLFNTLNDTATLIHSDPKSSEAILIRLGEVLRFTLERRDSEFITVAEEMRVSGWYLDIWRIRLRDRFTVEYEIEREVENAAVPSMILQPVLENSVRHGLTASDDLGRIRISVRRISVSGMRLQVSDNGPGLATRSIGGWGIGLSTTHARLRYLFGDEGRLDLCQRPEGGTMTTIDLPLGFVAADAEEERTYGDPCCHYR